MTPLNLIWFSSFLAYFFRNGASGTAWGLNGFGFRQSHCPSEDLRSCGEYVTVTRLTKPVNLGDAPFYDEDCNSVYFIDDVLPTIYRYDIDRKRLYSVKLGNSKVNDDNISAIIPIEGMPGKFLISYNKDFCILTWDGVSEHASFEVILKTDPCQPFPKYIINDVKVAPNDALFFEIVPTFMPPDIRTIPRHQSTLFSILDGEQKVLIAGQDYGNGLGWSSDEDRFYTSDSFQNVTRKFFYNQWTNTLEYPEILFDYAQLGIPGHPDSLTVDGEGFLWIAAQQGGRRVLKVDPRSGEVVCAVKLPAKSVTNVTFGRCPNGKFECLYATTSRSVFDTSPGPTTINDGALFCIQGIRSTGVRSKKVDLNAVFKNVRL